MSGKTQWLPGECWRGIVATALLAGMLSGCMTRDKFEAGVEVMKGSPKLLEEAILECANRQSARPLKEREETAKLINTSTAEVPETACRRIFEGFTTGKISYDDYEYLRRNGVNAKMVRLLQGR